MQKLSFREFDLDINLDIVANPETLPDAIERCESTKATLHNFVKTSLQL
jgi:hypothetical protein